MACGSCGKKYQGLRSNKRNFTAPQAPVQTRKLIWRKGRRVVVEKTANKSVTLTGQEAYPPVTVSPDIVNSPAAPVPSYPIDPSTGFAKSVIMTGESPGGSLGDTRTQPIDMTVVSPAPQDMYGGNPKKEG